MPPRPLIPADDLYARLELPVDSSSEAVEIAWRALLKRHHPDVAGGDADATDRAKRINVAHDWLSDPDLRARYDRERVRKPSGGNGAARDRSSWAAPPAARGRSGATRGPLRRPAADPEE